MPFGLNYHQLSPVANNVRAGIVSYNGDLSEHRAELRKAIPRFLGALGAVHGTDFPRQHLEAVIRAIDARDIEVDFMVVAFEACGPIILSGLATGAPTFGIEPDQNNNLKIFPVTHGEDLCVDQDIARQFRAQTRGQLYPDGLGAGTWFVREQVKRSVANPNWVFAGRDNEHSPTNTPIMGLMNKFGAIHGTEDNSAVLQFDRTRNIEPRWSVPVTLEALPADKLGLRTSPNNFLTRWASDNGKQQIAIIYRRLASTFDGQPVVWAKIKSNGNLPDKPMLETVMASLLSAGVREIESPERSWGLPRGKQDKAIYGYPAPIIHIHANNEKEIIKTLLDMQAERRLFGHSPMLSGVMNLRNIPNPVTIFGRNLPKPTEVKGIDPDRDAYKPIFGFGPRSANPGLV